MTHRLTFTAILLASTWAYGCSDYREPLTDYDREAALIRAELSGGVCREESGNDRDDRPFTRTYCVESGTRYQVMQLLIYNRESEELESIILVEGEHEGNPNNESAVRFLNFFDRYRHGPYSVVQCEEEQWPAHERSLHTTETGTVMCTITRDGFISFSAERIQEE